MSVTALEISSKAPFAGGASFGETGSYEQLDGTVRFAVNPDHPDNALITDLTLVPRSRSGKVTFSADFRILRPVDSSRGNRRLLLDVLNRGRQRALKYINSAVDFVTNGNPDPGNGFLMVQGYTLVWCGWQHDVPDSPGLLRIQVPGAVTPAGPISGRSTVTFQPNITSQVQLLADRMHRPYPTSDLHDPEAVLTVQDHDYATPQVVDRNRWSFAKVETGGVVPSGRHIYLPAGFKAGKIYRITYTTKGAPVVGLGLLATRDIVAFLRNPGSGNAKDPEGNPCAGAVERAYAFGASQSGRFLRQFLYLGLNQDENTAAEYWGGHAALIHTNVGGTRDIPPSDSVRIYHYAGTQHASGTFPLGDTDPATGSRGSLPFNCVDYVPLLRAALVQLDRWVSQGDTPPPSRHPRVDDGTAVSPDRTAATFQAIPGVDFPQRQRYICRLDFGPERGITSRFPVDVGKPYPNLVSVVDSDGNELSGIRLPDITVPLGTHTGWNTRHPDTGGRGLSLRLSGSTIPFPPTRAEKEATGDPRPSIEERYTSKEDYLDRVRRAAQSLIDGRYLLQEDLDTVASDAYQRYDVFYSEVKAGIKEAQPASD